MRPTKYIMHNIYERVRVTIIIFHSIMVEDGTTTGTLNSKAYKLL